MQADVLNNLTDPAILFFVVGVAIGTIRSNLEIPAQVAKFLSLYLLMALGFKGGVALNDAGLGGDGLKVVGAALLLAFTMPAICFPILRRKVNRFDAAAIAATYGSVSAVTFVTASQFLASRDESAGGYLTVALVVMESPAIVMAVLLATWARNQQAQELDRFGATTTAKVPDTTTQVSAELLDGDRRTDLTNVQTHTTEQPTPLSIKEVLHEAFTDGAHLLLIGSMVVGAVSGSKGAEVMAPFVTDLFKGLLAFFLLEMGLLVSRQLREVRDVGPFLIGFGLVAPLFGASMALGLGFVLDLEVGDAALLATLAASGSYIVVPAVVRYAIPEARPSRYFTMALAVTFPFNIILGIPLYYEAAKYVLA